MKLRTRLALTTILAGIPVLVGFWVLQQFFEERLEERVLEQYVLTYMRDPGRAECEASPDSWNYHGPGFWPGRMPPEDFRPHTSPPTPDIPRPPDDDSGNPPDMHIRPPAGVPPASDEHTRFPPGHGPKFGLFAYDSNFRSRNPDAPQLDAKLLAEILDDGSKAERLVKDDFFSKFKDRKMPFPPELNGGPPRREHKIYELLLKMPWEGGPCAYILARHPRPPDTGNDGDAPPPIHIWLLPVFLMLAAVLLSVGPMVRRTRRLTHEVREFARTAYGSRISVEGNDEIGQLAQAFKDAGEEIRTQIAIQEQRERTLRNFLDNTTHDVMIPLTVLQGHLSAMQERLSAGDQTDHELLSSAMSESQYITSLIHNLSVAAKIEEGAPALEWEAVNLNRLIERVIGRHRPVARQKDISIDYAVPEEALWCDGDMTFIEQSVNNVVYNAIRHNRPGGHVAVLLDRAGESGFSLRVIDDGPGIADDELPLLLEKCRSPNTARSREAGRHGLGLRIACQLASLHQWTFDLKRSEYGGLQVDFSGPRRKPPTS